MREYTFRWNGCAEEAMLIKIFRNLKTYQNIGREYIEWMEGGELTLYFCRYDHCLFASTYCVYDSFDIKVKSTDVDDPSQ